MSHRPTETNNSAQDRLGRLADYVLNQLNERESAEVKELLESSSDARRLHRELRRMMSTLSEQHRKTVLPDRSEALRKAVMERLESRAPMPASRTRYRVLWWALGVAACLLVVVLPAWHLPRTTHNNDQGIVAMRTEAERPRDVAGENAKVTRTTTRPGPKESNSMEGEPAEPLPIVETVENGAGTSTVTTIIAGSADGAARLWQSPRESGEAGPEPARSASARQRTTETLAGVPSSGSGQVATESFQPANPRPTSPAVTALRDEAARGLGVSPQQADRRGGRGREQQKPAIRQSGEPTGWEWGHLSPRANSESRPRALSPDSAALVGGSQPRPVQELSEAELLGIRLRRSKYGREDVQERLLRESRAAVRRSAEQYKPIVENEFLSVQQHPLSTFGVDIDTASYANVRRFLLQGVRPPANAVRLEELINYFQYDLQPPSDDRPIAIALETSQCPWDKAHLLVRVAVKGKEVHREERPASNLVFLLDVSGSMSDGNKLPLLKQAMKLLVDQLTEDDRVAIVTYAGQAGLALDSTRGNQRKRIWDAIDSLRAGGSTNGSAGIELAYEQAAQHFVEGGTNRVILATDGDLNVGITSDDDLVRLIRTKAEGGVFLTVLGFGEGNLKDGKLEQLADNGNGLYAYVDRLREARKVLVEQMTGSLITVAKDVKIQVEFNPAEVSGYRLIGYENRALSTRDFDDDRKDAGDMGAGHAVTVLYEVTPAGRAPSGLQNTRRLKYQTAAQPERRPTELTSAAGSGELLTVFLRYKEPDSNESSLIERVLKQRPADFLDSSDNMRFAAAVASFGMLLRDSRYRGTATYAAVEEMASGALGKDERGYRTEFLDLVRLAETLK